MITECLPFVFGHNVDPFTSEMLPLYVWLQGTLYKIQLIRLHEKENFALNRTRGVVTSKEESDVTHLLCVLLICSLFTGRSGCVFKLIHANLLFPPPFRTVSLLPLLTLCQ